MTVEALPAAKVVACKATHHQFIGPMTTASLLDQVDQSALSNQQQLSFKQWLDSYPAMQTRMEQALQNGKSLKAFSVDRFLHNHPEFILRVELHMECSKR